MMFQAWPGGTGALMEKLAKERGRAAFERANFTVEKWRGAMPKSDDEIAYLPAHRLSALIKERKITSERSPTSISRASSDSIRRCSAR